MVKTKLDEILDRLRITQQELEAEIERLLKDRRELFHYSLRRGKVVFERNIRRLQRQQRAGLWNYLRKAPIAHILSSPVIYSLIVPLLLLDISITIYQHISFIITIRPVMTYLFEIIAPVFKVTVINEHKRASMFILAPLSMFDWHPDAFTQGKGFSIQSASDLIISGIADSDGYPPAFINTTYPISLSNTITTLELAA
jgi:hypothetical protein